MPGPEAEPSGNDASASVDHLAEVLQHGLEIGTDGQAQSASWRQGGTIPWGRQPSQSRQAADKENSGCTEITPSKLTCFNQLREELTCAVCLDICARPVTTPCGHNYCRSCLRRSLEITRPKCPKCRADLPASYALNINTSLWITIQHLFPAEAGAKPLTPPPPAEQQQPAGGQRVNRPAVGQGAAAAHGNSHVAVPFRPPRSIAAASFFSGQPSSRANAASTHAVAPGSTGLVNVPGRSLSGPRSQRSAPAPSAGQSNPGAPPGQQQASGQRPTVFSLAELGVRPGHDGAATAAGRRERRRSRSAERWEGSERSLLAASMNDAGPAPAAGRPVAGVPRASAAPPHAALPASSSRLMELLSGPPQRNAAAAGIHGIQPHQAPPCAPSRATESFATVGSSAASGPNALQVSSSGRSQGNPFLRLPRPAAATQAAAAATATAAAGPTGASGGVANFTASQRALLNARTLSHGPSDARAASSRNRDQETGPDAYAAMPRGASSTSQGSSGGSFGGSRVFGGSITTLDSSLGSSWSARALDEASELEVSEPERGLLPPHGRGGDGAGSSDGLPPPRVHGGGPGCSTRKERDPLRADGAAEPGGATRDSSTAARAAAAAAFSFRRAEPAALPSRRLQSLLCVDDDDDDASEVSLGSLDVPTSPSPPRASRGAAAESISSSPTWSQLDDQLARAMEPLRIADSLSPPGLPRLRLQPLAAAAREDTVPSAQHQTSLTETGAARTSGQWSPLPATGLAFSGPSPGLIMDSDLASNYDGEDPAGADTFFSSPFFDRTMLEETLAEQAAAAADGGSDGAGSGVGLSPRWALAAAGSSGGAEEDLLEEEAEGSPPARRMLGAADRAGGAAARGALAEARLVQGTAQSQAALASQIAAAAAPVGRGLQAGDRGCPIELLSDSEEEELVPGLAPSLGASRSAAVQGAATAPARRSSQRVVSGLRRPRRA
ncbi:hypothetical protein PLESTF_001548300 [Pleodorina starrii]|nr:hypothetical protein PLESTF_001548300 [Pleodorina starrii]